VDDFIAKNRLPSPPGTLRLPVLPLQEIDSQLVREALLYRMARFVSPEPWGSPRAELGRRKASMNRLLACVWDLPMIRAKVSNSVTVGSGVWWRLMAYGKNQLRSSLQDFGVKDLSWVALRQPAAKSDPDREVFRPLKLNVTHQLLQMRQEWLSNQETDTLEILFDRRFLISFRVDKIPNQILDSLLSKSSSIQVIPRTPWILPQVVHHYQRKDFPIHKSIIRQEFFWEKEYGTKLFKDVSSDWISIELFRPVTAL
jgi:tRNA(Ile)-lysidine synthase